MAFVPHRFSPFGGPSWFSRPYNVPEGTKLVPADDNANAGGGWRNFFGACLATFVGVTVFIILLGFASTTFSSVCTISLDGTCSAGCDCVKVDVTSTKPGTYREYEKIDIVALMLIVGLLRFSSDMFMSRFSTGTLDWFTDVADVVKNYIIGDHVIYKASFFGASVGHVLAGLVGTLVLWGWNETIDGTAFAELTRHGSHGRIFRSHLSLAMIVFVSTLTLLWSRYKYMYSDISRLISNKNIKGEFVDVSGVTAKVKFMPMWPELKHQMQHASVNAVAWSMLTGTTCFFVGPAPLIFWQTAWAAIIHAITRAADGVDTEDIGAVNGHRQAETYYLMFLLYPFLRLVVPFFMWAVLWFLKGLPSHFVKRD